MRLAQPIRVLALDDDQDDIALLRFHVEDVQRLELELTTATTPEDFHRKLAATEPHILVLDFQLGPLTGLELFRALAADGLSIPAILVTDQGDEETAVRALHEGFADYIPKEAVSARSLERAIGNALEKSALRAARDRYRRDLERTVRELSARTEEITSFYHTLSHELKTPLTASREFVSIVLDETFGSLTDGQRDALETARGACDQMRRLIDDLLDASRMETGKLAIHVRSVPVDRIVSRAAELHDARARKRGVALETRAAADLPAVLVDEERMQQVLANLIGNALKFTDQGGSVSLVAERAADGRVAFTVRDTGRGIEPERLERVFDRLYQAHERDDTTVGGLGLGLHICRELCRLQGGEITVESELGSGSAFTVVLPAATTPRPRPSEARADR